VRLSPVTLGDPVELELPVDPEPDTAGEVVEPSVPPPPLAVLAPLSGLVAVPLGVPDPSMRSR
jgi:hypothetical protein